MASYGELWRVKKNPRFFFGRSSAGWVGGIGGERKKSGENRKKKKNYFLFCGDAADFKVVICFKTFASSSGSLVWMIRLSVVVIAEALKVDAEDL